MDQISNELDPLQKLLQVTSRRHEAYSSNMANVNTPGYQRSEVVFEKLLRNTSTTDVRSEILRVEPRVEKDESPGKTDGNNVDLDKEMGLLRKNDLLHRTFIEFLNAKIRILRSSIQGRNS